MQQQQEPQDQTGLTLPITLGFAEPLIFAHQWASLHQDTPYSDPQEETLLEEEAAVDSQEEETLEEEAADSQAVEDLYKVILKEDHQEIDSWVMRRSSTTEITSEQKNSWQHGNSTKGSTEARPRWITCTNELCYSSLTFRDPQPRNGSTRSVIGLNKQFKYPTNTIDECGNIQKKHSNANLETRYLKKGLSRNCGAESKWKAVTLTAL